MKENSEQNVFKMVSYLSFEKRNFFLLCFDSNGLREFMLTVTETRSGCFPL
jgi:hypothetical protein